MQIAAVEFVSVLGQCEITRQSTKLINGSLVTAAEHRR
jgi:hypothetical protein